MSLIDPSTDAEGGIDPLGMAFISERLSDSLVKGVRQRMARPRFMSLMCVQAVVNDDVTVLARDGTSPDVAFEWLVIQAFAELDDDLRRVPGMQKVRRALRDNLQLSARTYLKGPKIFGFHGVYKTLAVSLGLIDDDLRLHLQGERLVSAVEKQPELAGLLSRSDSTPGGRWRRKTRETILQALSDGFAPKPKGMVHDVIAEHLRIDRMTKPEAEFIRALLTDPSGGTRGEVFTLLDRPEVRKIYDNTFERPFLRELQRFATPELRATLVAIEGFEAVAKPLQDAFDWMRFLSTKDRLLPVSASAFAQAAPNLVAKLRAALDKLPEAVAESKHASAVDGLMASFADVTTQEGLFHAILRRHEVIQRGKPPNGRRPWFEKTADGGLVVRPLYRVPEPPPPIDSAVHFYRMSSVCSYLDDMGAAK